MCVRERETLSLSWTASSAVTCLVGAFHMRRELIFSSLAMRFSARIILQCLYRTCSEVNFIAKKVFYLVFFSYKIAGYGALQLDRVVGCHVPCRRIASHEPVSQKRTNKKRRKKMPHSKSANKGHATQSAADQENHEVLYWMDGSSSSCELFHNCFRGTDKDRFVTEKS